MSATYNAGIVTAYGAAVRGGYTGTYAQFCSDLADLGVVLSQLGSITASASQLPEGSSPTASYTNGNFAFGIPKGDTGVSITSIAKTGSVSGVDTYTITLSNGTTSTFTVTNAEALIDDTAGAGDTDKLWSADKLIMVDLLENNIPGTTATATYNDDGDLASIVHTASGSNTAVRTDTFVWGETTVVETRTLANGTYITITTNLDTLETVVSETTEG